MVNSNVIKLKSQYKKSKLIYEKISTIHKGLVVRVQKTPQKVKIFLKANIQQKTEQKT